MNFMPNCLFHYHFSFYQYVLTMAFTGRLQELQDDLRRRLLAAGLMSSQQDSDARRNSRNLTTDWEAFLGDLMMAPFRRDDKNDNNNKPK